MAIEGLAIIAESLNDSVPSTKQLFDDGDIDGILELARFQDRKGAAYIDVNVGTRPAGFMADMVRKIQRVTAKPLAIDTPDPEIAEAGLAAFDAGRAGGKKPILNSVSPLRLEMFDLYKVQPFMPILLASEQVVDGHSKPCRTAEQSHRAAKDMVGRAGSVCPGLKNTDCIIDPGISPIGSDAEGDLKRLVATVEMIHADADLAGVHFSVGLSNFTVMLPPRCADGSPVKSPLESAFLTKTMPLGLDMVIGSVKRQYRLLPPDHPAMQCIEDCLKLGGFEAIMRVREFYT